MKNPFSLLVEMMKRWDGVSERELRGLPPWRGRPTRPRVSNRKPRERIPNYQVVEEFFGVGGKEKRDERYAELRGRGTSNVIKFSTWHEAYGDVWCVARPR